MDREAFSPEELETLLEDAVVLGDGPAVARLSERDGVIVPGLGSAEVRGRTRSRRWRGICGPTARDMSPIPARWPTAPTSRSWSAPRP